MPRLVKHIDSRLMGCAQWRQAAAATCAVLWAATAAAEAPLAVPVVPPGLPPALGTATSVDAAFVVLGAGKPEMSSHLLLEVPDIAGPGRVSARARSTLPATGALFLLRGRAAPVALPGAPAAAPLPAAGPALPAGPALLGARLVRSGQDPSMRAAVAVDRTQTLTLLAYAQGRWFQTTREVKVGKPKSEGAR